MEMQRPLVSVVVPTYNTAAFLDQCLNSIEGQTYDNLEIICLNDGSTDGSLGIMKAHAARDPRIVVVDKANEGYGATCNRGIDEAHGSYLAIVEPDDWIEPDMYQAMVDFALSFDRLPDIVKTPYWRIWMPDTPQQRKMNCSYRGRVKPPSQPFVIGEAAHLLTHHPSIWSALYRIDFLRQRDIRFKRIPGAGWADNPFLVETFCQAEAIAYLDEPFYCYREETPEHFSSFTRNSTLLPLERWNDMADVLERLGVTDERVLRAHNSRGFTYLHGILAEVDMSHEHVREAAARMFERMDADLVFDDPEIPPDAKRLFATTLGLPEPKVSALPYRLNLVKQGFYNLKNVGIGYTFFIVTNYLKGTRAPR